MSAHSATRDCRGSKTHRKKDPARDVRHLSTGNDVPLRIRRVTSYRIRERRCRRSCKRPPSAAFSSSPPNNAFRRSKGVQVHRLKRPPHPFDYQRGIQIGGPAHSKLGCFQRIWRGTRPGPLNQHEHLLRNRSVSLNAKRVISRAVQVELRSRN